MVVTSLVLCRLDRWDDQSHLPRLVELVVFGFLLILRRPSAGIREISIYEPACGPSGVFLDSRSWVFSVIRIFLHAELTHAGSCHTPSR